MKNTIAILMLAGLLTTACSTNETPTTEPTTESVDSLYQDTVELGGSVDTTAAADTVINIVLFLEKEWRC